MAWYDEAVFYHIYPLGMTGAEKTNSYSTPIPRLRTLFPWIDHIKECGFTAIYIGPLFESVGHGYETTDYKKLDSRLGINSDLKEFVSICHQKGLRVIFDGVFNHTGRDFFAFQDIKTNRENSPYKDWYCNVNFWGNNEYNDGFSYDNWGGYNLLAKLNQNNPKVREYILDVVRFWVTEFDVDGIRLDAADVLDLNFMQALRAVANEVKADFWLMGEVIHGDYSRWANDGTLHSVTNYQLHKALYSGHNDKNYFEIAHTVKRLNDMFGNKLNLYNFVDNHDVERIYTKLTNKANFAPTHILLYTLPGIPSLYYGSEFAIDGRKERYSDDSLRPYMSYKEYSEKAKKSEAVKLIGRLGAVHQSTPALSYGDYKEVKLTCEQYVFSRTYNGESVFVAVNNSENAASVSFPAPVGEYMGALFGEKVKCDGTINFTIPANSGEIFILSGKIKSVEPLKPIVAERIKPVVKEAIKVPEIKPVKKEEIIPSKVQDIVKEATNIEPKIVIPQNKSFEDMTVEELQQVILDKMAKNGPVTDYMKKTVYDNTHPGSLVTWAKSFN